jgi:site-specific DNA-methyltransferase (adenine-specific)
MPLSTVLQGDCAFEIKKLKDSSIDSIVTDPPYELGFMGKSWDSTAIAYDVNLWKECLRVLKPGGNLLSFSGTRTYHRMAVAIEDAGFEIRDQIGWLYSTGMPKGLNVGKSIKKHDSTVVTDEWDGWNTSLRPSWEPICFARKPLDGTVAENVIKYGTGGINIDASRIAIIGDEEALGRWPANVIHDGSDEIINLFPYSKGQQADVKGNEKSKTGQNGIYGTFNRVAAVPKRNDSGSAARFFYSSKASKEDRAGSNHPTIKPIALIKHLVKMVTPANGVVLDIFGGSGTTAQAALEEGFDIVIIEKEQEYCCDIQRRIETFYKNNSVFNNLFGDNQPT